MIDQLAIAGYRSIRSLVLRLRPLNVVTGPNGSGKSNLYRALKLLPDAAEGRLVGSLAQEGGFASVLWAGPEKITREMRDGSVPVQGGLRSKPVSLRLGLRGEPYSCCIDLGLPPPTESMFAHDPEIKRECLWHGASMEARSLCADRRGGVLRCRSRGGSWQDVELQLAPRASMLAQYADPFAAPELIEMRELLRSWRFYDTFRTDAEAPARRPAVGTFTPVMSGDGSDLAAAMQTIREIGDHTELEQAIDEAFPGCRVEVDASDGGMQLLWRQPGMLRALAAAELSEGTLRFLLWVAALLTPRPPELMVLNEPEGSLHPDLIEPLGRLIRSAAERSQVIVVSHHPRLVESLAADEDCAEIRLSKQLGETTLEGAGTLDQYWKWPAR